MTDSRSDESFPALARRREATIETLTRCYSDDLISVTEFEKRVETAQNASTYSELDESVSDLPVEYRRQIASTPGDSPRPTPSETIPQVGPRAMAILGEREVTGEIFEGGFGSAVAVMGTLDIDLEESQLVDTELTLHVFGLMSDINLTVPEGTRVELELTPILADVKLKGQNTPKSMAKRVLRVTGMAVMSDLKVRR